MNQDAFTQQHESQWQEFEAWLAARKKKKKHQKTKDLPSTEDIPHLYRQLCHHLALARARQYSAHLVEHLNQLVIQGHQCLYQSNTAGLTKFFRFIFVDFPALVRREAKLFWLSTALFYLPMLAIIVTIQIAPEMIYSVMSPEKVSQFESMYDPAAEHIGRERDADSDFMMFGYYIKNNISIGFQTFAGGLLFGLGSLFFLLFNGLYIGAVAGHLIQVGHTVTFFSFVSGHSAFELTAIVIAGTAGLKLGLALIKPGQCSRVRALREAGRISMRLVYGVILMLLAAAFIEAFWSSKALINANHKYAVGGVLWVAIALYFLFMGRRHAD